MGFLSTAINKSTNQFPALEERAWHNITGDTTSIYEYYKSNDYENAYPSISKIVNRFMLVAPYAIDKTKKRVDNAVAVEKLYHANQQMSSVDFREALAVMYLVHPRTHILVWRLENGEAKPGGQITPDNIAGYTFLENAVETTIAGKTTYTVNGNQWSDSEVVTLKGMFPYNLARGYSSTEAAKRWSRIDDYIADYQQGFFKNGAIPSGQFIITAPTAKEYKDIVEMMQARHRGAGKNNNVTYAHRPVDPNSGKPAEAQIEWIPFNVDNKNLDLKSIFDQVNQKIDSAFGVPASIRGVGENNNFATAQQDDRNFVQNIIDPLTLKIWTRFMHELNRITGGLGYAITYDLEIPSVSEDEKIKAERSKTLVDTVINAVGAGFTAESVISAIEAPESFQHLIGNYTPPEKKEDLDVDTEGDVEDSPIQPTSTDILTREAAKSKNPKVKQLTPEQEAITQQQLYDISKRFMESQVDRAVQDIKAVGDPTEEEIDTFVRDALIVIGALLLAQGMIEQTTQVALLQASGVPTNTVTTFRLSNIQITRYRSYLTNVAQSYSNDTAQAIRAVLDKATVEQLPAQTIRSELRNIVKLDDYRAVRLARTETVRAGGNASLLSMEQIQAETGAEIQKIWNVNASDPCPYCASLDGTTVGLREAFVPVGGIIEGTDGSIMINDFVSMEIANGHPNCRCSLNYKVVK